MTNKDNTDWYDAVQTVDGNIEYGLNLAIAQETNYQVNSPGNNWAYKANWTAEVWAFPPPGTVVIQYW